MSGPIAIEYVLVSALLNAAWSAYQAEKQRRYERAYRDEAAADERERARRDAALRRDEERRAREEVGRRAERAAELMQRAKSYERRLERARSLADEARKRFPQAGLELPALPAAPADATDPEAIQRYIDAMDGCARATEERIRAQSARAAAHQGLDELMKAIKATVQSEPRTAADLLALYAEQVRVLQEPHAARSMDRRATAERILGRLASVDEAALPHELDALMRKLIEAESDQHAEMFAMELRAQVQRCNEAHARAEVEAAENRKREMAGVLVAEVLSDLGYEVEPIAETLFVAGGVAHFQRAEWGDYYVRMRVDPATRNVNFNMVRAASANAPPDAAQRKRDEAMEATWCAGIPKLLAELAARGIDTKKLRELDAGAVPVQLVAPETVDACLRVKGEAPAAAAPRQMARPIG
ncbi:MAG: hypothetical protein IT530_01405 [Burkholderiales bacterium]|nr:hypothetical protein [Burkholderiales bacterium]